MIWNHEPKNLTQVLFILATAFFSACANKHPEMQENNKMVLCDSLTMKQNHENCETIYIEPTDSTYQLIFSPFSNGQRPKNPYHNVHTNMSVSEFYKSFMTPVFDIILVKNLNCIHLTGTDHLHHVYFNFKNNSLQSIDYSPKQ